MAVQPSPPSSCRIFPLPQSDAPRGLNTGSASRSPRLLTASCPCPVCVNPAALGPQEDSATRCVSFCAWLVSSAPACVMGHVRISILRKADRYSRPLPVASCLPIHLLRGMSMASTFWLSEGCCEDAKRAPVAVSAFGSFECVPEAESLIMRCLSVYFEEL